MATTRKMTNGNLMTDWTEEVNNTANMYGLFNGMGLFGGTGVSTESITFDKTENTVTLLNETSRRGGAPVYGKGRTLETFALALPYFSVMDYVTPQDVQGWRRPGTPDGDEQLARVVAEKILDLRFAGDQTREFMKVQAVKGKTVTPEGRVLADMFSEFGMNREDYQVDFDLGNKESEPDLKIAELKRGFAKNAKTGGAIGALEIACSTEFFDKLVTHPKMKAAYQYYQNNGAQLLRDDLSTYEKWGVSDSFRHRGVLFYTYDAEFHKSDGSTEKAFSDDTSVEGGYTIAKGVRNLYRGYFGPSNRLSDANKPGSEMYVFQYRDPKDRYEEMELEMAPLYVLSKPQMSWKVISSS